MRTLHVYSGLLLPVPVLLAIVLRAGAELRADLGRLNRWSRRRPRMVAPPAPRRGRLGKFNPGQKLNATFIGGRDGRDAHDRIDHALVRAVLGLVAPGATFVHDWFAIVLVFAIAGHILLAFRDPDALNGMVRGSVTAGWAKKYRPRWYTEMQAEPTGGGGAAGIDQWKRRGRVRWRARRRRGRGGRRWCTR